MTKSANIIGILGMLPMLAGALGAVNSKDGEEIEVQNIPEDHLQKILLGVETNDRDLLEIQNPIVLALRMAVLDKLGYVSMSKNSDTLAVLTEKGKAKLEELNQKLGAYAEKRMEETSSASDSYTFMVGDPVSVPSAGEQWDESTIVQIFEDEETGELLIKVQNTVGAKLLTESDNVVPLNPTQCDCPSCVAERNGEPVYRNLSIRGVTIMEDGEKKIDMTFGVEVEDDLKTLPVIRADKGQILDLIKALRAAIDRLED